MFNSLRSRRLQRQADAARDQRRWHRASDLYGRLLQSNPDLDPIWVQYGHALKENQQLHEAETAYRRALSLQPDRADTHLHLGGLLRTMGQLDAAAACFARALALDDQCELARTDLRSLRHRLRPRTGMENGLPHRLRFVAIGTTGLCNASCLHCPTGKPETAHAPRTPMPMPLFEKIITSIVDLDLPVTDQISLGLFGDGLVDPFVVNRLRLVRSALPDVRVVVNTNGAAFNAARHAPVAELASQIALHVESIEPETYDVLMQPLRYENVAPKLDQLLTLCHGKVLVSVPVSRLNRPELPGIRRHFLSRGAIDVVFDPLSSRCADDPEPYFRLAIDPTPIRCGPEVMDDLIVDCDGLVLACCQDFKRREPIGDLTQESLKQVLTNPRRQQVRQMFETGRHCDMNTCSRCYGDIRGALVVPKDED